MVKDTRKGDRHKTPRKGDRHKTPRKGDRHKTPRKSKYNWSVDRFLAWDGEGMNDNTEQIEESGSVLRGHRYVYLANSTGAYIYNQQGLTSAEILHFLCEQALLAKDKTHIIYGGSYDFNMFLRTLPWVKMAELKETGHTAWDCYEINVVQGKYFSLRRWRNLNQRFLAYTAKNGSIKYKPDFDVKLMIWDILGFFQSSFVSAIERWLGEDYPDLAVIKAGKMKRGDFAADTTDFNYLDNYTGAELNALLALAGRLLSSLQVLDLPIARFDGAGAVAAAMYRKNNIGAIAYRNPDGTRYLLPQAVQTAAEFAYFGGRIEMLQFGHYRGAMFNYDINSAYPAAVATLPNLTMGQWQHHVRIPAKGKKPATEIDFAAIGRFSCFRIRWKFKEQPDFRYAVFPFPLRNELQGMILYPAEGHGWVWHPELNVFYERFDVYGPMIDTLVIEEAWDFVDTNPTYPFSFVQDYYQQRQELLKLIDQGIQHPEEKVIKLGLNSIYGKMAQRVGWKAEEGNMPVYHNLAYAGYVTAAVRAKLIKIVAGQEQYVVSLATDGIFSTRPLDIAVSANKELGSWSLEQFDGIISVQSGLYYTLYGDEWYGFSRGLDKITGINSTDYQQRIRAQIDKILLTWRGGQRKHLRHLPEADRYFVSIPTTRFITYKSGIRYRINERGLYEESDGTQEWYRKWCNWRTTYRNMDTVPFVMRSKRVCRDKITINDNPSMRLFRTEAQTNCYGQQRLGDNTKLPWSIAGENPYVIMEEALIAAHW